ETSALLAAVDLASGPAIQQEMVERERRVQDLARNLLPVLRSTTLVGPTAGETSALLAAADLASGPAGQRDRARMAGPGGARGFGGMGPGGMMPGGGFAFPGMGGPPGPDVAEQQRKQREKMAAFLRANHNGERWCLAVSGVNAASTLIIEEGLSIMPIGGFGNNPTLGSEPEQVKARLAKMVENGEIRFFQVARGGGFGGFGGRMGGGPGA